MIDPELLKVIAWPITVLIIFLFLKKDIKVLLSRVISAELPGGAKAGFADYGKVDLDKRGQKIIDSSPATTITDIKWDKPANIFWIGHDLIWTIDVILRGAPRETIVHGLKQSLFHLRKIGFAGTSIEARLSRLHENAEKSLQTDWTDDKRAMYANEVANVAGFIGSLVNNFQPDYDK